MPRSLGSCIKGTEEFTGKDSLVPSMRNDLSDL